LNIFKNGGVLGLRIVLTIAQKYCTFTVKEGFRSPGGR
jgi:hypothetical protein